MHRPAPKTLRESEWLAAFTAHMANTVGSGQSDAYRLRGAVQRADMAVTELGEAPRDPSV